MPHLILGSQGARAVVAGSGAYVAGSRLPAVESVAASVTDLGRCLVERAGLDPAGLTTVVDPADPVELGDLLVEAAREATDALVFCFVGHGLVGADNELYLATHATVDLNEGITQHQALPYAAVRQALAGCTAPFILIILDCCFSGRAAPDVRDAGQQVLDATPRGTYLLTAAGRDQAAWAPAGERHTSFTGALVELLTVGEPTAPGVLTLDDVYRCLSRTLSDRGLPAPRRQATDQGDRQLFAPNPAGAAGDGTAEEFSPYRGLAAFGPEDADYFFGRTELTRALLDRVAEQAETGGMLLVTGPSGSGKSSLLRAGLISALRRSPGTEIAVMTPGSDPVGVLATRMASLDGSRPARLRRRLEQDPAALESIFRQAMGDREGIVIVDQFEEVFTACADKEQRRIFIQALHALSREAAVVVIGVRADFFGHCAVHAELVPALGHPVVVGPMTPAQLRQAIEGPARLAGLTLQPGLIELILEDLGFDPGATEPRPEAGGGAAMLPLLSHALLVTWQHREGRLLTMGGYRATGGIRQALARTADATLEHLDLSGRRSARQLLTRLIRLGEGQDDTRRDMPLAELLPVSGSPEYDATRQVLDRFVRARLLTVHADTAQIAHEALIRAWPQLRLWIETDRATLLIHQQLEEDAAEWLHHARDPAFLYSGTRLSAAQEAAALWRTDPGRYPDLSDVTSDFLRAGQSAADRLVRRRRQSLLALVLLLVLAVAGFATSTFMAASAARERADSLSRQLAAQSESISDTDIDLSRWLSTAAWHVAPTNEARLSLLRTLQSPQRAILRGHTGAVSGGWFNRDGSRVLTYGEDGTARLWNGNTGGAIASVKSRKGGMRFADFNKDGTRMLTLGEDGMIGLWDAATGAAIGSPVQGSPEQASAAFSPDGSRLAAGGAEGPVRVLDTATGETIAVLAGHSGGVTDVVFNPDGSRLATSSFDGTVRLWDSTGGRAIETIEAGSYAYSHFNLDGSRLVVDGSEVATLRDGHTGEDIGKEDWYGDARGEVVLTPDGSRAVVTFYGTRTPSQLRNATTGAVITRFDDDLLSAFSPDGSRMATMRFDDTTVRLRSTTTGKVLAELKGHTGDVNQVTFAPDGSRLATIGEDGTARLWDGRTGRIISVMTDHAGAVEEVSFSPDGSRLATIGDDRTVRIWDGLTGDKITTLTGHTGAVSLVFSPDGSRLVTTSDDRTARIWDVRSAMTAVYRDHRQLVHAVALSPDGSRLATAGEDGLAVLREPATGRRVAAHEDLATYVFGVAFSSDSARLVTTGEEGAVHLLNGVTGAVIGSLDGHSGAVKAAAFSPRGPYLATVGDDGTTRLWDARARRSLTVAWQAGPVLAVAYSPDGSRFATGGFDGTVRLWDGTTGKAVRTIRGHAGSVYSVAFSPDGSSLASGGYDGIIRLWDVATGKAVTTLNGHTGPVYGIAFSPDGTRLASGGADAGVHLWDRATSRSITTLLGHTAAVYAVAFSSDGRRLATGGGDRTTRLWDVPAPADPFAATCALIGKPMGEEQWAQYLPDDPYERVCP